MADARDMTDPPLLTEKEILATMDAVDAIAHGLTALALLWLWENPDETWRSETRGHRW